jgi:hypothetical protein
MLAYHHRPACLSLISTDLPILSSFETAATLYEKDRQKFHILLDQPVVPISPAEAELNGGNPPSPAKSLLWLELSPYRAIMTMQGNGNSSYRHFWEQGVYGVSRYWLHNNSATDNGTENDTENSPKNDTENGANVSFLRLRNFTRSLTLKSKHLPEHLRVEYELWSDKLQLGHYVLHLEIDL